MISKWYLVLVVILCGRYELWPHWIDVQELVTAFSLIEVSSSDVPMDGVEQSYRRDHSRAVHDNIKLRLPNNHGCLLHAWLIAIWAILVIVLSSSSVSEDLLRERGDRQHAMVMVERSKS